MSTETNATSVAIEKTALQLRIEAMQKTAAAKYASTSVVNVASPEQTIKDAARVAIASLNIAGAIGLLQSVDVPENCDIDKTAKKILQNAKNVLTNIVKKANEHLTATGEVLTDDIDTFNFEHSDIKIEFQLFEVAPDYKGAIMVVDFSSISDDAKQKLHLIGINADAPIAILTSVTLDKSVNVIFLKVAGDDLAKGHVRLSAKYVALLDGCNEPNTVDSFNAKIAELTSQMVAPDMKFSPKSFEYTAEKIQTYKDSERVKRAILATFPQYAELPESELTAKIHEIVTLVNVVLINVVNVELN